MSEPVVKKGQSQPGLVALWQVVSKRRDCKSLCLHEVIERI